MVRFFGVFLIFFSFLPLSAMAETVRPAFDLYRIPDLPEISELSVEGFELMSALHEETPMNDPALGFRVRLPSGWVKAADFSEGGAANLSSGILGEVARFYSPPDIDFRSLFSVMTIRLEERMSLRNWVVNHALVSGHTLEGIREIRRNRVESQYVTVEGDMNYRVRAVATMNGTRILLALYKTPYSNWEDEKGMQALSVSSFTPTARLVEDKEGIDIYAFLEEAQFEYMLSWRLRTFENRTLDRMRVTVINGEEGKSPKGWINVLFVRRAEEVSLQKEIDAVSETVRKSGLVPGAGIETIGDWKYDESVTLGRVDVFEALPEDKRSGRYEVWRAILVFDEFFVLVNMVTVSREDLFSLWATNAEAFRRLVETFEPYDGKGGSSSEGRPLSSGTADKVGSKRTNTIQKKPPLAEGATKSREERRWGGGVGYRGDSKRER